MPPEPVPWDRKDYAFKDYRKHERGSSAGDALGGGGAGMTPRWRDPYPYSQRDFRGPSPRRPPPGHYRQGGSHHSVYSPDSGGHVYTPSRSEKFWSEDESFRPSMSSRYGGSGRSSSGGFGNRDGHGSLRRSPYYDAGEFPRAQHRGSFHVSAPGPRSGSVPISPASQPSSKDHNDKTRGGGCGGGDDDGLSTGHKIDHRDSPLGSISSWKSKWSRQSSITLTSKACETEAKGVKLEVLVPPGKDTPLRSPVTSPLPSEDVLPKKKPRLGWGQGLAKYEKQKVEGSVDASSSGAKGSVCDTSPRIVGIAGSLSPATPCSATFSTSLGGEAFMTFKVAAEDKTSINDLHGDIATCRNSELSEADILNCSEEDPFKLDDPEVSSIAKLTSLLSDLLQPEDACSGDSVLTRHPTMSKLLTIKECISKQLEKTECEIDLFETELRSLDSEVGNDPFQVPQKKATFSASDVSMQVSEVSIHDLALPNDTSKDATVLDQLHCTNSVGHDIGVKSNDDASISKLSPSCSPMISLASELQSDNKGGLISVINLPEEFKDAGVQQSACGDTGRMSPSATLVAEDKPTGLYSSSIMGSDGREGPNIIDLILSDNQDASKQALKELNMCSPSGLSKSDIWELDKLSACRINDAWVKDKIATRKRWLKFKEKVLTLKFRAFNHLWKEDLRLLSLRKERQKSSKRVDINSRSLLNGSQKQRSSLRTRSAIPTGNFALFPTTEIADFTSKILSDSQIRSYRNNLKMPALILDVKERSFTRFITNNGLMIDPVTHEKEREMINPWSQEEKEVFMEMLATFGKDFSKIASFLNHKSTADCIEFYYKNHKSESFKEVKQRLYLRKLQYNLQPNTYLVTSEKKWNVEANAASLDILGAASVVAEHDHGVMRTTSQKPSGRTIHRASSDRKVSYGSYDYREKTSGLDFSDNDRETVAADVLAGICGSMSSKAMSSCITSSIDLVEMKKLMPVDQSLTAEVNQSLDEDICSDENCGETDSSAWTDEEKSFLIRALSLYGRDFDAIATCVGTRTREQCKIFFSKARKCLGLDNIQQDNDIGELPLNDANGERSDTNDTCAGDLDSGVCSTQSCSKLEAELSQSHTNNNEDSAFRGSTSVHDESEKSSEQHMGGFIVKDDRKVDMEVPSFDDSLICQGSNSPLVTNAKEREDYTQTDNENLICAEVVNSIPTRILPVGSSLTVKPVEPVTASFLEAESKPAVAASIQLEGTCGNFPSARLINNIEPVTNTGLINKQQPKVDLSGNSGNSFCFALESGTNDSALAQGNKVSSLHAQVGLLPNLTKAQLDPHSSLPTKLSFLSMQERAHSLPLSSYLPDSSSISFGGQLDIASKSTLNFEEHGNKRLHNMHPNRDVYQFKSNTTLNHVDGQFQVLRGYPLQILNQHETKEEGDPVVEKSVPFEAYPKENGFPHSSGFILSASHGNKGNSVGVSRSDLSTTCSSRSEKDSDSQTRSVVRGATAVEQQQHRTGDVKLFGKILTNPSTAPKSTSSISMHDNKSKPPSSKVTRSSMSSGTGKDDLFACRYGGGNHIRREDIPITFGFWDGSRIQTGLTTLPDPALMMSKYPTSLAGLSFYSQKDGLRSNVLTDCQQSYVQNLSSDDKRVENFTDLQRINGRDIFSGFQQLSGPNGANMIGGEILVGSEEVSDPVEALKLHYAARAKVEVDSWRTDIR